MLTAWPNFIAAPLRSPSVATSFSARTAGERLPRVGAGEPLHAAGQRVAAQLRSEPGELPQAGES